MPYLIDEVRDLIDRAVSDPEDSTDPNDFLIFDGMVLPHLEDRKETGFDSAEMFHKGFGFLVGLIPRLLNRRRAEMEPTHFGMLAKIYHRDRIEGLLKRIDGLDDSWYEENLPGLYRDLEFFRLIRPRT